MTRILLLGPPDSRLAPALRARHADVRVTADPLDLGSSELAWAAWLISYGYRHKVAAEVLARVPDRALNLHTSLLPWNRGAHPNFWSFYDGTPRGVTVHHMSPRIDHGDVIVQRAVPEAPAATLSSSYAQLADEIEALFLEVWPAILAGTAQRTPQRGTGTTHRVRDLEPLWPAWPAGWDTPVTEVIAAGRRARADASR